MSKEPSKHSNNEKTGERTVLGFDFGTKRIGIAIGQELTATATGIETISCKNNKPNWQEIDKIIEQWQPSALVVGIPVHMDNTEHDMTVRAQKFCRQLQARYQLTVYQVDERLSSYEAETELKQQSNTYNKQSVDSLSAQIILQSWLTKK